MNAAEPSPAHTSGPGGTVTVRFWASARAAAGVPEITLDAPGEVDLDTLVDRVLDQLGDRPDLARVLRVCSALVGDRPVGPGDRSSVVVPPGTTVELLPPFAGG